MTTEEAAQLHEFYFVYQLGGNGAVFYDSSELIINNGGPGHGDIQIDLTRNNQEPEVGVYEVEIAIDMIMRNPAGDILMHEKTYQLTTYLQGAVGTAILGTSGLVEAGNQTVDNSQTNVETSDSQLPVDLSLISEGNVGMGQDIVLQIDEVGLDSTHYKIWLDRSHDIAVFTEIELINQVYEWPIDFVAAVDTEDQAGVSLTVTLKSVPTDLYNLGKVYVKLGVKFRDLAGDIRMLELSSGSTREVQEDKDEDEDSEEELSADFVTSVTFESYKFVKGTNDWKNTNNGLGHAKESSYSIKIVTFIALIAGIAVGALMTCIFLIICYRNKRRNAAVAQQQDTVTTRNIKKEIRQQRKSLVLNDGGFNKNKNRDRRNSSESLQMSRASGLSQSMREPSSAGRLSLSESLRSSFSSFGSNSVLMSINDDGSISEGSTSSEEEEYLDEHDVDTMFDGMEVSTRTV